MSETENEDRERKAHVQPACEKPARIEPGTTHDVEALEDSAFLLTIAWPSGA